MRIGINGFGRIGRNFAKALIERHPGIAIAAVNDLTSAAECAHLFKFDSNYGTYAGSVRARGDSIFIDSREIKVLAERDPAKLPWRDLGCDLVIESTGLFADARARARAFLERALALSSAGRDKNASQLMDELLANATMVRFYHLIAWLRLILAEQGRGSDFVKACEPDGVGGVCGKVLTPVARGDERLRNRRPGRFGRREDLATVHPSAAAGQ